VRRSPARRPPTPASAAAARPWRGHGADLDKAESEAQQRVRRLRVLVEAGGETDRIGEIEPEGANGEFRGVPARPRQRHIAQGFDGQRMRILRVEGPQQRADQPIDQIDHQIRLRGCTFRPYRPDTGLFKASQKQL
jgi:hypothetical protein